ncbi:MAG: hypothetical protein JXA18_08310, partial [Chitinispirillaceae bacterium]|nr:hypothetical protein [Chitinispirillaceae bacterium]
FHSWSSNGRWFVFSSRRRDGLCTLPYFAYIDTAGNVSKPFLLPQRDPRCYTTLLTSFNVPVLAKGPVTADWRALSTAAGNPESNLSARLDSNVRLDGITNASVRINEGRFAP